MSDLAAPVLASSGGERRLFTTPEGVELALDLAGVGQRAVAFLVDFSLILLLMTGLTVAAVFGAFVFRSSGFGQLAFVLWTLGLFVLRNGYFIFFELGGRGATPGKRLMAIRVASRSGGRLTAEAVFARNVMREGETMLPLTLLAMGASQSPNALAALAALVWAAGVVFLPVFNRDRLRLGDMLAGTWVVRAPKPRLLTDVSATGEQVADRFAFTDVQLGAYGERELQVLEAVVRRNSSATVAEVAARIRRKIDWAQRPGEKDIDFLDAYYLALRRKLETGLVFGRRRRDKNDL